MKNTRELTLNAMFVTIIVIMGLVPFLGIFPIGPLGIQIIHIPVIIAGLVLGFKSGVLAGFSFGAVTLFVALTRPSNILHPYFTNPLVSILPRLLFGMSIGIFYNLLNKFVKSKPLVYGLTAFLSTIAHTIFVFIALSTVIFVTGVPSFGEATTTNAFFLLLIGSFVTNGLLEGVAALVVVPPVVIALNKIRGHRS